MLIVSRSPHSVFQMELVVFKLVNAQLILTREHVKKILMENIVIGMAKNVIHQLCVLNFQDNRQILIVDHK